MLLTNSIAKKSSFSSEMEVHMDKCSKVLDSPRKMSLGDVAQFNKAVKIADIIKASAGQNLDVTCKVVEIGKVENVKKKSKDDHRKEFWKQEPCRLVLWEAC